MSRFKDLSGLTFERLTVLHRIPNREGSNHVRYACRCSCGTQHDADGSVLKRGGVKSCGCLQKDGPWRHGLTDHPLYHCWYNMNDRCYDTTNAQYAGYGGRGITVCDEWRGPAGLVQFVADMVECPPDHSIERIDNDGPYCKANCRWATRREQQNNRRGLVTVTHDGKTGTLAEWARWTGISHKTLAYRLKMKRPLDVVFSTERFATYGSKRQPQVLVLSTKPPPP